MDKSTVIKIAKDYVNLVLKNMKPKEIILYGSYAKGTAREDSDIDIAVIVSKVINDYLDEAAMLYMLRVEIDSRIEPILLEDIYDRSGFLDDVRKTGYTLYSDA
jgi:predicted nucleotidyltransferase